MEKWAFGFRVPNLGNVVLKAEISPPKRKVGAF